MVTKVLSLFKKMRKNLIFKRSVALLLSFILMVGTFQVALSTMPLNANADEFYFGLNTLDNSRGNPDSSWFDAADSRYSSYASGFILGNKSTPYIIKDGDELFDLSLKTNAGNTFAEKYIDVTGLSEAEAAASNETYTSSGVIDLRMYDGSASSASGTNLWLPISGNEQSPFAGHFYSSTNVSIINLCFPYTPEAPFSGTAYGLFGHNNGSIGEDGGFKVSAMSIATAQGETKELNFTSNVGALDVIGGVVANNASGGKVANVDFGVGKNYDVGTGTVEENPKLNNSIIMPQDGVNAYSVGGIVGKNSGVVDSCSFMGKITTVGDYSIVGIPLLSGMGSIAGFSNNIITNCVANAEINVGNAGATLSAGGICGTAFGEFSNTIISSCVFTGSLSINSTSNIYETNPLTLGGIVGNMFIGEINKCAVAADISVMGDISVEFDSNTGGIVGNAAMSAISECFGMGSITTTNSAGGIVSATSEGTSVDNCYYTGSLRGIGQSNGSDDLKAGFDGVKGTYAIGGIIAKGDDKGNTSVSNCYFAGATLSSDIGSLFGKTAFSASNKIYYDRQLSPNAAISSNTKSANHDKTTDYFKNADFAPNIFVNSNDSYPQLAWAKNIDESNDFGKFVKAISSLSTVMNLNLSADNSFSNAGERNAYQMKAGALNENTFNPIVNNGALGITAQGWSADYLFKGVYNPNENLGGIFKNTVAVLTGKYSCNVNVTKKLLMAVNQTENDSCSISDFTDFQRFLDISNYASGAYFGGVFELKTSITAFTVSNARDNTDSYRSASNNFFCSELKGNSNTFSALTFVDSPRGMLSVGFGANIHDVSVESISFGSQSSQIALTQVNNGAFFSKCFSTKVSGITINSAFANFKQASSNATTFGMIAGRFAKNGDTTNGISSVTINDATVKANTQVQNLSYGLIAGIIDTSFSAQNFSVANYTLNIGDYITTRNQNENKPENIGGLFGSVAGGDIDSATIENLNLSADIYEFTKAQGVGGIVGNSLGGVNNCSVSGKMVFPSVGGSDAGRIRMGGISGFGNNNKTYSNCSFTGELDGAVVGGIVANANNNLTLLNCSVNAIINGDSSINLSKKPAVGGLIALSSVGVKVTNSYFFGTATGEIVGGISGNSSNNASPIVERSYVKAIITSTSANGAAGGLFGDVKTLAKATSSYFAGQIKGAGSKGGIAGKANSAQLSQTYFDKNIAGATLPTIASITAADKVQGDALDAACSKPTSQITASSLDTTFYIGETATNYPQLFNFSTGATAALSMLSTQKIFVVENDDSFLTSLPNFALIDAGASYTVERNTSATDVLSPWDSILSYAQGSQSSPYGAYTMKAKGNTLFTAKYNGILKNAEKTFDMPYDISVKPFLYGNGTQSDPYIIFDNNELIKFREYLKKGFDNTNTYYKIGLVENGVVVGTPITLDLASYNDWEPIINLSGHLDGNDSVIKNISCQNGYKKLDDNNNVLETYFGFFGSTTATGDVKNLTIDNVNINIATNSYNPIAGAFIGSAAGGSYSNIVVTNAAINMSSVQNPNAGGLIGSVSLSSLINLSLTNCMVKAEINSSIGAGNGAGMVGKCTGANGNLIINNSASYGSITGFASSGGILGTATNVSLTFSTLASTMDIHAIVLSEANVGGIIGTLNVGNVPVSLNECVYGGKISYDNAANKYLGGIIGREVFHEDYTKHVFSNLNEISFVTPLISGNESHSSIEQRMQQNVNEQLVNCYYNSNINPYKTATVILTATFAYRDSSSMTQRIDQTYNNNFESIYNSKSNTNVMSNGTLPLTGQWYQENGYYPYPLWLNAHIDNAVSARNEIYVSDVSRFYSLALYYTNAGSFGDDTYSNIFVMAEDVAVNNPSGSDALVKTANGRMFQSTKEGSRTNLVISAHYTFDFSKSINIVPSVVSCGVVDASYYFANKGGMWVTSATTGTDDNAVTTAYPWTLYTADQLQGLTTITSIGTPDGNGLVIDHSYSYAVTPPETHQLGDTFTMGRDIDCGTAYRDGFKPISSATLPFNTSFNGMGNTISNLYLNGDMSVSELGLFAALSNGEISNVGIVSGQIMLDNRVSSSGAIVARLGSNASVVSCFSSIPTVAKNEGTSKPKISGGIVGISDGSANSIMNCFNTGLIYLTSQGSVAGGIIGQANNIIISNCYTSAYIEGAIKGIIFGSGAGNSIKNSYFDISACGNMQNTNEAISAFPTAQLLGNGFVDVDGLYTLPSSFASKVTADVKVAAIPIDMTNARSVTGGSISYTGATLRYVSTYSSLPKLQGRVGDSNGNLYGDNVPFTSFEKVETGLVFMNVAFDAKSRLVLADLQCWYDSGLNDGLTNHEFTINTAKELAEFAAIVNGTLNVNNNPNGHHTHTVQNQSFKDWTVKLGTNISLSAFNWVPIGTSANPFKGNFDGNGKTISDINITGGNADGNSGLFGTISDNAVISNLGVNGGSVASGQNSGAIVGEAINSTITQCFSNVNVSGANAGGICAVNTSSNITQCYNMGVVTGTSLTAGIAANNGGTIESCYNVGIISGGISPSGISAQNDGAIIDCYNGSYVGGATAAPIAPSGNITTSMYDGKMMSYGGSVNGVTEGISMAASAIWREENGDKYPELNCFANNSSMPFQDASELSVLKLDFGGGDYKEFVFAQMLASITTEAESRNVELMSPNNIFDVNKSGDNWIIEPSKKGANHLVSSVNGSIEFSHQYYVIAVTTMKIRYKFDFKQLFAGTPAQNPNYHPDTTTTSAWAEGSEEFTINTADDFMAFVKYVNDKKETTGKTFTLNYPIDLNGKTVTPIGTAEKPFNGTFNGKGYTVSNLSISSAGNVALFNTIGSTGKVLNTIFDSMSVTASATGAPMLVSCIAAVNNGAITNIGINNGLLTAKNASTKQETYLGVFAAQNLGTIRGCYFIQNRDNLYGIVHYTAQNNQFVGGMVGDNQGTIAGSYFISDIFTADIKAIAGNNHGKKDNILNCYFNVMGETIPKNLKFAFDDVVYRDYFVTESAMKSQEFAKWLSSNIYAGTYEVGTAADFAGSSGGAVLNGGLPYLSITQMAKYDLSYYATNRNSMMLSIWNKENDNNSRFMNGVFAFDDLDFKFYRNIITHQSLQFDMTLLPDDIGYEIVSRIYGSGASFLDNTSGGKLIAGNAGAVDVVGKADGVPYEVTATPENIIEPNLIVVTISLKKNDTPRPWGVFREWTAT